MHVFISYAKKDTLELVQKLRDTLVKSPGITAWMDDSLTAGEHWSTEIETEIDRADYVIVLLSPDVNRSATASQSPSFVINEINYAMGANKTLVPIIAVANTKLPIQLAGRQYKDVSGLKTDEAKVAAIIGELAKLAKIPLPPTGNGGVRLPKNEEARTQNTAAWIGAGGVILAALIGAFALLWVNKDNDPAQTPPPPPSITATFAPTDTALPASPTDTPTETSVPSLEASPTFAPSATETIAAANTPIISGGGGSSAGLVMTFEEGVFTLHFDPDTQGPVDLRDLRFVWGDASGREHAYQPVTDFGDLDLAALEQDFCVQLYYGRPPDRSDCGNDRTLRREIPQAQAFWVWFNDILSFQVYQGDAKITTCTTSANYCTGTWGGN